MKPHRCVKCQAVIDGQFDSYVTILGRVHCLTCGRGMKPLAPPRFEGLKSSPEPKQKEGFAKQVERVHRALREQAGTPNWNRKYPRKLPEPPAEEPESEPSGEPEDMLPESLTVIKGMSEFAVACRRRAAKRIEEQGETTE